ncbi:MAG: DNA-deoxyinosine glycosylase [Burkholderiales bacterium]|jgi:hypoxanthine-DNA glycosylase
MADVRLRAPAAGRAARTPARAPLAGLPPVIARDTRVLILGSFPSVASLAAGQYYAHPRNHFWLVLGALLGEPLPALAYRARLARVRAHRVGIWDTIVACERPGSLDADIRNALRGEIGRVTGVARDLRAVCFNGATAARAEPAWRDAGFVTLRLPSTSPAYTRPLAEKVAAWRAIEAWL